MAGFTVIIALATVWNVIYVGRQLKEMKSSGIDTQNLARAAKDQATATGNLAASASDQARSMSSLAKSTAGELDALKSAAAIARGEADSMRLSASAALKAADTSTGQLAVLNRQMDLSQAAFSLDHRPRLKFEINEGTGPLEVTNQGIIFGLSAKFTNVGNLEAEEVSYGYSFSIADTEDQMRGAQGSACSQAESETAKASIKIGEELGWNTTIATNRGDFTQFMQLPDSVAILDFSPRRYAFAGCVVYKSPVDKIVRHTRFLYYIGEKMNGKIVPGIVQVPHKVAPGDILVSKDAFAGNNDD